LKDKAFVEINAKVITTATANRTFEYFACL